MIDKQQVISDIHQMDNKQKYAHVMSALSVVMKGNKGTESHIDATYIIKTHARVLRESMMETAQVAYY